MPRTSEDPEIEARPEIDTSRRYRGGVLAELARHGIVPREETSVDLVREVLRDLYTFRLRRLRQMQAEMERVMGPQPIEVYRRKVLDLKADYPLLSLPARLWLEPKD